MRLIYIIILLLLPYNFVCAGKTESSAAEETDSEIFWSDFITLNFVLTELKESHLPSSKLNKPIDRAKAVANALNAYHRIICEFNELPKPDKPEFIADLVEFVRCVRYQWFVSEENDWNVQFISTLHQELSGRGYSLESCFRYEAELETVEAKDPYAHEQQHQARVLFNSLIKHVFYDGRIALSEDIETLDYGQSFPPHYNRIWYCIVLDEVAVRAGALGYLNSTHISAIPNDYLQRMLLTLRTADPAEVGAPIVNSKYIHTLNALSIASSCS